MVFSGRVWKFGNDLDTDVIITGKYLNIIDPGELAKHCLEAMIPDFYKKVKPGDIIVALDNFGCGSSREQAPVSIKAAGISCIVAKTFARIFYRNSFNIGLPLLECSDGPDYIEEGHEIEVNIDTGQIRDLSSRRSFQAKPIPSFMQKLIEDGGLMNHVAREFGG
jgi:3-isopropylmalate/(R)-2-methylmalate dehydratase small subunit